MGLLIYLDDLKSSSVVARETAKSFQDKLAKATNEANEGDPRQTAIEPQVLELQGWHKSPLVIFRPLERIIYFTESPDAELKQMMDQQKEIAANRRKMMSDPQVITPGRKPN